jgi:hypothetical protein
MNTQWAITAGWTVPDTVPAAGADVMLSVVGTEMTHDPNASICPRVGGSDGFTFAGQQSLSVCAQNDGNGQGNPATASKSTTVKLIPPSSGKFINLVIGVQDGCWAACTAHPRGGSRAGPASNTRRTPERRQT